jgi:hypothetical protein
MLYLLFYTFPIFIRLSTKFFSTLYILQKCLIIKIWIISGRHNRNIKDKKYLCVNWKFFRIYIEIHLKDYFLLIIFCNSIKWFEAIFFDSNVCLNYWLSLRVLANESCAETTFFSLIIDSNNLTKVLIFNTISLSISNKTISLL